MTGDEFLIEDLVESNVFGIGPDENDADELFHRIRKAVDEVFVKVVMRQCIQSRQELLAVRIHQ